MALTQTAAPAVEPLTLAEVKAALRIDHDAEDAFLTSLIVTSRLHVETALDLALITQSWTLSVTPPADGRVALPVWPVREINAVRWQFANEAQPSVPVSAWTRETKQRPVVVCLETAPPSSDAHVEIDFEAGFGAAPGDVPEPIRHTLKLLVAHWYENREPAAIGSSAARIPDTVSALLAPYRQVQL